MRSNVSAYHLTRRGAGPETLLLEADKLTSGTTWHSAAMINSLRSNVVDGLLARHTKELVSEVLEKETGVSPGFKRHMFAKGKIGEGELGLR